MDENSKDIILTHIKECTTNTEFMSFDVVLREAFDMFKDPNNNMKNFYEGFCMLYDYCLDNDIEIYMKDNLHCINKTDNNFAHPKTYGQGIRDHELAEYIVNNRLYDKLFFPTYEEQITWLVSSARIEHNSLILFAITLIERNRVIIAENNINLTTNNSSINELKLIVMNMQLQIDELQTNHALLNKLVLLW